MNRAQFSHRFKKKLRNALAAMCTYKMDAFKIKLKIWEEYLKNK
jgi:hypothetical protein